ncbi:hypothetical protein PENTCL1PPCAC_13536, partial [Pristionchus entomophagus]
GSQMKIVFIFLFASSFPINAASCDCGEIEDALEEERIMDADYHSCRSCKAPEISIDACSIGFECDEEWAIFTNTLSASDDCSCLQARCGGNTQMAADRAIVSKIRCNNNSEWIANGAVVVAVVCAKGCDRGVCKARYPRVSSSEFSTLNVYPSDVDSKCATGHCDNGLAALNADGTLGRQLDAVKEVTCSSDGMWTWNGGSSAYVMCNAEEVSSCFDCAPIAIDTVRRQNGADPDGRLVINDNAPCRKLEFICGGLNSEISWYGNAAGTGPPIGTLLDVLVDGITCQTDGTWKNADGVTIAHLRCTFD